MEVNETALNDNELEIRDRLGHPPIKKYIVSTDSYIKYPVYDPSIKVEPIGTEAGQHVYNALMKGNKPEEQDEN